MAALPHLDGKVETTLAQLRLSALTVLRVLVRGLLRFIALRLWRWTNAVLIPVLGVTGLSNHFAGTTGPKVKLDDSSEEEQKIIKARKKADTANRIACLRSHAK